MSRLPVYGFFAAVLAACGDGHPVGLSEVPDTKPPPVSSLQAFDCTGTTGGSVSCQPAGPNVGLTSGAVIGGQGTFVRLTSSNVTYDPGTQIFQFDVTVQNLMNEAIGTPDGVVPDPDGIRVFFHGAPVATGGSGAITVANADGVGTFTATDQPFFSYAEILGRNAVSSPRTWQLSIPPNVTTFSFQLLLEAEVQYLLVINEVMVNPRNPILDPNGEWFELYNAGTRQVDLQGLVIADSAASGRRPYHLITSSVVIPSGGYAVLGGNGDTTVNGGVSLDYSYGLAFSLANSLDAIKISRVVGTDTLTLDRTQYSSAAISAQDGISRELRNPALDNSNMDGSNWAGALSTAVYGPGGQGTPGAQNSTFVP